MRQGFPAGVSFIPVPAPLLGEMLTQIDDLDELKVTLRALWLIHQKKGSPRPLRADELLSDRVCAAALGASGAALERSVERALARAVDRGALFRLDHPGRAPLYFLNTEPERRGAARLHADASPYLPPETLDAETWPADAEAERPNVFRLYEENIGSLTPIAAQRLTEARASYGEDWIAEAIKIAVENNARNWKYVAAILERWSKEGRGDGESRRDPEKARLDVYWEVYGRYLKRS